MRAVSSVLPLAADVAHTLTGVGSQQISAYRLGRNTASDTQYWLTRSVDADFARSLIAEDTTERTYSTDGTKPKYTDNTLLGGSEPYPASWVDTGVPYPDTDMTATETTPGTWAMREAISSRSASPLAVRMSVGFCTTRNSARTMSLRKCRLSSW